MKYYAFLLISVWLVGSSFAQDAGEDSLRQAKIAKFDNWKWRISPYAWVPAIRGEISTPPEPTLPTQLPYPPPPRIDFKILFKDLRPYLKFLSVFTAEHRGDRFMAAVRFDALVLDAQPIFIVNPDFTTTLLDFAFYGVDVIGGYRWWRNDKFELDAMLGFRYIHFDIGAEATFLDTELAWRTKNSYYDPFVALRLHYKPHYRLEFSAYGDITPIPYDGNYSFQGILVASYLFNPHFFLAPGYRFVGHRRVDETTTYFDGNIHGLYVRIGFQF